MPTGDDCAGSNQAGSQSAKRDSDVHLFKWHRVHHGLRRDPSRPNSYFEPRQCGRRHAPRGERVHACIVRGHLHDGRNRRRPIRHLRLPTRHRCGRSNRAPARAASVTRWSGAGGNAEIGIFPLTEIGGTVLNEGFRVTPFDTQSQPLFPSRSEAAGAPFERPIDITASHTVLNVNVGDTFVSGLSA